MWDDLRAGMRGGRTQRLLLLQSFAGPEQHAEGAAGEAAAQEAANCTSTGSDAGSLVKETPLSCVPPFPSSKWEFSSPRLLFPFPGVCEYSFLSGKLNILNKHCLKSIIYGQSFRRGDQLSLGAEGGSPSAAAPAALFAVNWRGMRGQLWAGQPPSSTQKTPSSE